MKLFYKKDYFKLKKLCKELQEENKILTKKDKDYSYQLLIDLDERGKEIIKLKDEISNLQLKNLQLKNKLKDERKKR